MAEGTPAISIDLGTCFSRVAVLHHGQVEIIPNEIGNRKTPSCVAFTETEHFVGEAVQHPLVVNPASTATNAKRLIGRPYEDPAVQNEIKFSPSQIINEGGKPKFQAGLKSHSPEEIASMVLLKMKETAEAHLGKPISNAVITVPSYFNDSQRRSIIDAGKTAKLNVLRVINESMAVAIAYDYKFKKVGERKVLIFELGGASFNVSIIEMKDGNIFNVKSTAGEPNLGGEEIVNRMVDHFAKEFKKKHKKNVFTNKKALSRLRSACEHAKKLLSLVSAATISVVSLMDGFDFESTMDRTQFEELNEDLFQNFMSKVEEVVKDAKIQKSGIDDIYLSGGSTHIPKLQKMLQDSFNGKKLNKSIHPEEVVAYGAAVQAAVLEQKQSKIVKELLVPEKSTGISIKITKQDSGTNQADILFHVSKEKILLDKFTLKGIPLAPSKSVKVEVSVDIDDDEILSVSGKEVSTGIGNEIKITKDGRHLEEARANLESFCVDVKSTAEIAGKLDLVSKCDETIQWLSNKNHQLTCGKEDYESRKKEIERLVDEADEAKQQQNATPSKKRALKVTARKSTGGGIKYPRLILPPSAAAKEEKVETKQKVTARKSFGAVGKAKVADPPKKADDEDDDPDSSEAIAVITL